MRVTIVHNAVADDDAPDERDVLVQAEAVQAALRALGHEPGTLPCTLDLSEVKRRLTDLRPDLVFNIVESLDGKGRLIHVIPLLLDALNVPYTGACAEAMCLTSHKVLAKQRLAAAHLPTPPWIGPYPDDVPNLPPAAVDPAATPDGKWIVKSVWEHASIGLDETTRSSLRPRGACGNAVAGACAPPGRGLFRGALHRRPRVQSRAARRTGRAAGAPPGGDPLRGLRRPHA